MKIAFYYVDIDYINYLKQKEIEYRGFTTIPNFEYKLQKQAQKTYKNVMLGEDKKLLENSCAFEILEEAYREYIKKQDDGNGSD